MDFHLFLKIAERYSGFKEKTRDEGQDWMARKRSGTPFGKRGYRVNRARRLLRTLVGTRKKNVTFATRPDDYYSHVWLTKPHSKLIAFLAELNGTSKKEMVRRLLEDILSDVIGQAVEDNDVRVRVMRARGIPPTPTPFVRALLRWATAEGYNIKMFFT